MIDLSTNLANTSSNKPHNYHEQSQIDQTLRLREVLKNTKLFIITIIWNHQILTVLNLIRRKFVNLFHFCNIIINRLIII